MLKHVVMFKFKNKDKDMKTAKEKLIKIAAGGINGCKQYEVEENIASSPFGYDLILNSAFESKEALGNYAESTDHQAFLQFIVGAADAIAESDYIA